MDGGSSSEDEGVTSRLRAMQLSGAEESVAVAGGDGGKGRPDDGGDGGTTAVAGGEEAGNSGAVGDVGDDEFGEFVS